MLAKSRNNCKKYKQENMLRSRFSISSLNASRRATTNPNATQNKRHSNSHDDTGTNKRGSKFQSARGASSNRKNDGPFLNLNDPVIIEQKPEKPLKHKFRTARKRVSKMNKVKSRYSHCFGKKRYGFTIGHTECTKDHGLVPKNMGWLWNVPTLGINKV